MALQFLNAVPSKPPSGSSAGMSEVTHILEAIRQGGPKAAEELLPLVYDELRRLASRKMANERPGQTLQPTALVHEAWLRLVGNQASEFENRAHFFAAAAEAMRRILVDSARRRKRLKHGGHLERVDVDAVELPLPMPDDELLALDEALDRLATVDARAAEMVKHCFFVGLTQEQAAKELGVSIATAERLWAFARAWLFREMQKTRSAPQ
jgi:RNA polymerase sigma factor (TIGR02999 family)